jgi:RsiW-degrading membrane proteinase PrsW (M82 family)
LGRVFNAAFLRKKAVRWVLMFALLPLVLYQIYKWLQLDVKQSIWLIEGYFCLFWTVYFYQIIRPSPTVWRRALLYAGFTAMIGIPLLLASHELPGIRHLYAAADHYRFFPKLIGNIFGVGVLEELCKALPLLIFAFRKNQILSVRDGVFLGLMSGFGFAAVEGVQYTFDATLKAIYYDTVETASVQFMQFIFRMMTGPVLHGAWAGIVGWFIAMSASRYQRSWPVIIVGLFYAATLHGVYDVFSSSIWGIAVAGISVMIFMYYLVHGGEDTRKEEGHEVSATPSGSDDNSAK